MLPFDPFKIFQRAWKMKQWRVLAIFTLVCTLVFIFTFILSGDLVAKWVFGIFTFCLLIILPIVYFSSVSELKEKMGDFIVELAKKSDGGFERYKSVRQDFDRRVVKVLKNIEWAAKDYEAISLSNDDRESRSTKLREIIKNISS